MNKTEIEISSAYLARCQKRLKEWNAPLSGWHCVDVYDKKDDDDASMDFAVCELCGCAKVRFVHVMEHDAYFEPVEVGCICAGVMEGDILAAKERERLMRNRTKRRTKFPSRQWHKTLDGTCYLHYQGKTVCIRQGKNGGGHYSVWCDGLTADTYKGRPIDNFLSAAYAAFDLADPVEEVMRQCVKKPSSRNL